MSRIPFGVAVAAEGAHPAAWRHADQPPRSLLTPARLRERFRALDDSALAFATVLEQPHADAAPDVRGALDTVEAATFAAAVTSRIGLVAETNVIHAEPFHLANQLNTLDWAASGRSGWLVRIDDSPEVAARYGRDVHADAGGPAREAREVIDAVRLLWDTWEDEIFLADETTHRFLDVDRWHYADVVGEFFRIKGPGLLPRPPQGRPPIWTPSLDATIAPLADLAIVSGPSVREIEAQARRVAEAGIARAIADVEIVVDARGVPAAERLEALNRSTPWPAGRLRLVGAAGEIADRLAELSSYVDGVRLHPAVLDVDVAVLTETVLPALDRAGVLHTGAPTQRELFALGRAENLFALAEEQR